MNLPASAPRSPARRNELPQKASFATVPEDLASAETCDSAPANPPAWSLDAARLLPRRAPPHSKSARRARRRSKRGF